MLEEREMAEAGEEEPLNILCEKKLVVRYLIGVDRV